MKSYGGAFKILNRKQYSLAGTNDRFIHLATIAYGVQEFMFFLDRAIGQTHIEEITGGSLTKIDDDKLWAALGNFLQESGLTQIVQEQ